MQEAGVGGRCREEPEEGVQRGARLLGEGKVPVPLVVPLVKSKLKDSYDRKRNLTSILMIQST